MVQVPEQCSEWFLHATGRCLVGNERVLLENAIGMMFILLDVALALWFFGGFSYTREDPSDAGQGSVNDDAGASVVPETVH